MPWRLRMCAACERSGPRPDHASTHEHLGARGGLVVMRMPACGVRLWAPLRTLGSRTDVNTSHTTCWLLLAMKHAGSM